MALYKNTQYNGLSYYEKGAGEKMGSTTRGLITSINPVIGAIASAGHYINKLMPKDEYGIGKNGVTTAIGSALDQFDTYDWAHKNVKEGNLFKGMVGVLAPGVSGLMMRHDQIKERDAALRAPDQINYTVGDFDPLAGRFSGNAIGVDKEVIDNKLIALNNRKVTSADTAELVNSAMSLASSKIKNDKTKTDKTKTDKTKSTTDEIDTRDKFEVQMDNDIESGMFDNMGEITQNQLVSNGTDDIYSYNNPNQKNYSLNENIDNSLFKTNKTIKELMESYNSKNKYISDKNNYNRNY